MPPFLPRKRSTPPPSPRPTPIKRARLADALDADATNNTRTLRNARTFSLGSDDSSSDSSLSDVDSDQFEDIPVRVSKSTTESRAQKDDDHEEDDEEDDEEDEDMEWEDAAAPAAANYVPAHVPMANGPIQITLRNDEDDVIDYRTTAKAQNGRQGPSKREKQVRVMTHQLHVQFLLWHNAVRNNWVGDKKVQEVLVKQLPPQIVNEVEKWRRASGLVGPEVSSPAATRVKGKRKSKEQHGRSQRDWGKPSQRLEVGKPDMSHGDPLITLLKVLSAYWKKRFAITLPGLRKRGYGTKFELKQDIASLRHDEHDPEKHGEKIRSLADFRMIAQNCQGSRDAGAQLFTALLRGLGIEARLVASLQPSGYGWTKAEQMTPKKSATSFLQDEESSDEEASEDLKPARKQKPIKNNAKRAATQRVSASKTSITINLNTDTNEEPEDDEVKDDESVIDVTPSVPKQQKAKYDRDLVFPIYWTEAVSPITNKVLPVSPLVLQLPVATTPEILATFEPKGAKAEKGRQVIAYVVAYSPDGSAKDVTVRYLRKQIWPGKTRGFRMPIQKMPIYDKAGRVKRYENFDWFKATLSPYTRSDHMRTAVDDVEDTSDLVPQQPETKAEEGGVDTLQSLKNSADYVLERFLRREEALRPEAKPVRTFTSGKGENCKAESVYRRADVERCLTAESWHKEGRSPKLGEVPMKMVPVRAVTLTRKREAEEHERQYGEKQTQGLYSWDQTEWIIPPPIENGIIPKNAYGNMDCFVPSMVPRGAVHIPLKGTVRICKRLEIDYAEAVTGFEFGNKRAVPVCTGVVVAKENEKLVKDAWHEWNEEQRRKEETKMEKLTLDLWRKFVLGLRIRERVQDMYGEEIGIVEDLPTGLTRDDAIAIDEEEHETDSIENGGGFMREEDKEYMEGGFLLPHEEEPAPMEDLIMDDHLKPSQGSNVDAAGESDQSNLSDALSELSNDSDACKDEGNDKYDSDTSPIDLPTKALSPHRSSDAHRKGKSRSNTKFGMRDRGKKVASASSDSDAASSNTSKQDGVSESGDDQDGEDILGESEQEEIYTPRSTRTRTAKRPKQSVGGLRKSAATRSVQKAKETPKRKVRGTMKPKKTERTPRSKQSIVAETSEGGSEDGHDDGDDDNQNGVSAASTRPLGKRRGRPRRDTTAPVKQKITPKRSRRLVRKESTLVTSPYFDH